MWKPAGFNYLLSCTRRGGKVVLAGSPISLPNLLGGVLHLKEAVGWGGVGNGCG